MPISDSAAAELVQLLGSGTAGDLIPELVRQGLQALIEAEAAAALGADRHQRTAERRGHRNGSRDRLLATPAGDIQLRIPRFRTGSFFPSLLEPRRRVDRALWAVVMEAYVSGVSTRKVDELVVALGCESGVSKSEVSRICQGLDTQVQAFLQRPLEFSRYPYVYLDATYLHGRDPARRQVISRAVIVAVGITGNGQREVLGIEVGDSEDETFWTAFLRRLRERGLSGVQLVISDAHAGLKKAIARCCQGCSWQRCRVHFARNLLAKVPKGSQDMVAAALRSVFVQPEARAAGQQWEQWEQVTTMLTEKFPAAAALMEQAKEDVLAFRAFPPEHWRKIWSTNPLERLNKEIKRRTRVVGIFPNDAAIIRLVGALLLEQQEEWQLDGRRVFSEQSMAKLDNTSEPVQDRATAALAAAA
ncbi:IS256 family transposase [Synechococcus sp. RSCCF101]|uniref:IS256 family transposase n=1 Tax=Synechococcus sp. RSCCF101 TaxID=2511069 RepID=UPI0012481B31|nr:IS256 family transposase [Synechococcus sp. RSCCF101]QEY31187.1 IS256 family transposase [Synechococcus sp. RSCCF101]